MNKTAKEIILQYVIDSGSEQCFIDNLLTTQDICIRDIIGVLYDLLQCIKDEYNTMQSPNIDLPSTLPKDTLIKVRNNPQDKWQLRYFATLDGDKVRCYIDGTSSKDSSTCADFEMDTIEWHHAAMLTPEEITTILF